MSKKKETPKKKREVAMVTLEDGTTMKRVDYIRKLYKEGMKKSEIAKKLDIPYQYVWQATRKLDQAEQAEEVPAAPEEEAEEDF